MAEEKKREKLPELDIEGVKKEYSTEEGTNAKGQKRLRVVLEELKIPKEFVGRRVYVAHDYEEKKYYLMHSHNLGDDPKVKAEIKAKREEAQAELRSKKDEVKAEITEKKKQLRTFKAKDNFDKATKVIAEISELEKELKSLPRVAKI